ncbi:hypothetical protein FRB94_003750 [Tulasnella sp. JGI-2019a]|nr:hypothetical protein FRB93_000563 [Tulasnella sp. JGI-2019a]KAG8985465.1 hypothetical protein FRB94_003750 [Tulasnella sp. JGI-2019a]
MLSLREVLLVEGTEHKLNVDVKITLLTKVHQRLLTETQKEWYMDVLDEMEVSGVCARVPADYVKCVSSTNLQPKDAGEPGMSRDEIVMRINELCREAGLPPYWKRVSKEEETPDTEIASESNTPQKRTPKKPRW